MRIATITITSALVLFACNSNNDKAKITANKTDTPSTSSAASDCAMPDSATMKCDSS